MADMRKCIGSAKFGIAAHQAPAGDFPRQPSQKDGLGRMCKVHWRQYTGALRKAALERKAREGGTPEAGQAAPKPEVAAAKPTASARKARAPKPETAKAPKATTVVAATSDATPVPEA